MIHVITWNIFSHINYDLTHIQAQRFNWNRYKSDPRQVIVHHQVQFHRWHCHTPDTYYNPYKLQWCVPRSVAVSFVSCAGHGAGHGALLGVSTPIIALWRVLPVARIPSTPLHKKMQSDWVQVLKQYIADPMFGHLLTEMNFKVTRTQIKYFYTFLYDQKRTYHKPKI